MVCEVFRPNFSDVCTAEVRLKDSVGARMSVLNADTDLCVSVMRTATRLIGLFQPIAMGIRVSHTCSSEFVRLQVI